jgi:hypothetical protein
MEMVCQGHPRSQKIGNRTNDATRRQIPSAVVVAADNEDARMMPLGVQKQVVQELEIAVIVGKKDPAGLDAVP